jgi:hypothetical protein
VLVKDHVLKGIY